jgi:putative transposase
MPSVSHMQKSSIFLENHFYHIFNRGNNKEIIFYNDENYAYFLKKFDHYLTNCLYVFAYCLLPNHFHFLIKVKENDAIADSDGIDTLHQTITEQFRRFFLSYSQSINKQEKRTGSLFQKHFKRKLIDKENYLTRIIYYIHLNPAHHKISNNYKNYPWSSYKIILSDKPTKINREKVLNLFESKESFIELHNTQFDNVKEIEYYLFE